MTGDTVVICRTNLGVKDKGQSRKIFAHIVTVLTTCYHSWIQTQDHRRESELIICHTLQSVGNKKLLFRLNLSEIN